MTCPTCNSVICYKFADKVILENQWEINIAASLMAEWRREGQISLNYCKTSTLKMKGNNCASKDNHIRSQHSA